MRSHAGTWQKTPPSADSSAQASTHRPDHAAIVRAVGDNLFLRPSVVRLLTHYWLKTNGSARTFDGTRTHATTAEQIANDAERYFQALIHPSPDLVLIAQRNALPTSTTIEPRTFGILHWKTPSFAIADDAFVNQSASIRSLVVGLASLASASRSFWDNVVDGQMQGHVIASSFRYMKEFGQNYWPILFIAHACWLLFENLRRALSEWPDAFFDVGRRVANLLGKALLSLHWPVGHGDQQQAIANGLGEKLSTLENPTEAVRIINNLVHKLNQSALDRYWQSCEENQTHLPRGSEEMVYTCIRTEYSH